MTTRTVTLGSIAKITSGGTPERTKPAYWNGTIPWVKTAQIQNCVITAESVDEWITQVGLEQSSARMIPNGAILMAMYGQGKTRGQVAILGIDATINQACAAILLAPGADRDYVYQQLRFRYESIRALSNTGSQENLNAELIREIAFPLPEIAAQTAIARALGEWDTAIQKTEQLIAEKEQHYVGLIGRLINGRSQSKAWRSIRIRDIAIRVQRQRDGGDYLHHSYKSFASQMGQATDALFIFGHSLADNDQHILKKIGRGKIPQLYVGLYGAPESPGNKQIRIAATKLAQSRNTRFPLEVAFFDAQSAHVWGT